jgi:hypothetical protein
VPHITPLHPPSERPMILSGIAAACSVDKERLRWRPWAFVLPARHQPLPPLKYRHGEDAGCIDKLYYDDRGALRIVATVDHPEGRRCGFFSVACSVQEFTLCEIDDPQRFHALVTSATLDEVSVTPAPSNPDCRVLERYPVSKISLRYAALIERVAKLSSMLQEAAA